MIYTIAYSLRYLNILGQALVCLNILTLKNDGINSTYLLYYTIMIEMKESKNSQDLCVYSRFLFLMTSLKHKTQEWKERV